MVGLLPEDAFELCLEVPEYARRLGGSRATVLPHVRSSGSIAHAHLCIIIVNVDQRHIPYKLSTDRESPLYSLRVIISH